MHAMKKRNSMSNRGYSKQETEAKMNELQAQLSYMHHKLKVQVDREVWLQFQSEVTQIEHTKAFIENICSNDKG